MARFHSSQWFLNYEHTAVRAAKCTKEVTVPEDVSNSEAVCPPCLSLFEMPEFRKMLFKPRTDDPKKMAHMEKQYVSEVMINIYDKVCGLQQFMNTVRYLNFLLSLIDLIAFSVPRPISNRYDDQICERFCWRKVQRLSYLYWSR